MPQDHSDRIIGAALAISRTLRKSMRCKDEDSDVNMLQLHALMHIRDHEGMTMKEVAEHLKITSPSATSFVTRLVKLGWVERVTDTQNRKLVRVKVSEAGDVLLQTKMKQRSEDLKRMLSLLSEKDQEELARILSSLAQSLSHSS